MNNSHSQQDDPYYIDFPNRVAACQSEMASQGLDLLIGSRLRTISWLSDIFCPWRSFIIIPPKGKPTLLSFIIDTARIANESWLGQDYVQGYGPMEGMDQIPALTDCIQKITQKSQIRIGVESGMSNYLPEGFLTHYEYMALQSAFPKAELINAYSIIDKISLIKDQGTINRFREAARIVDVGHQAIFDVLSTGRYKGMTETEISGIASFAMRKEGSEWEWSFTGGNEIASGYRTAYELGCCTPATRKKVKPGEALMIDIHSLFKLCMGDHAHNYFLEKATNSQLTHANHFIDLVSLCLKSYKPGITPSTLAEIMMTAAQEKGCSEFLVPGFEHGIGMLGDEWRIGINNGPLPFWTNPDHSYQEGEIVICGMQYNCPNEQIGFRYENPILITKNGCDPMSKYPLGIEVIS